MIGTDLNLTLPSTLETMATNISRIATALSLIEDSIAQKATPAALNINAPIDMQGNALTAEVIRLEPAARRGLILSAVSDLLELQAPATAPAAG